MRDLASRFNRTLAAAACVVGAIVGCDGSQRGPDASPRPLKRTAEVTVRFDVPAQGPITASALAFRASAAGLTAAEVMGVVDPLSAASPTSACVVWDLDIASRALNARGGTVELEAIAGIEVGLGTTGVMLRPSARLHPDVVPAVGGVVAESGPIPLPALPPWISVEVFDIAGEITELATPAAARIVTINGSAPGSHVGVSAGLDIFVSEAAGTTVELRPFGGTSAISCPAMSDGRVFISRAAVARLVGRTPAPVSFDAVRRNDSERVTGLDARLSVEVRSSAVIELHLEGMP